MEEWGYVADDLCCSETMRFELKQCLKYASLCGVDVEGILRSMYENGDLPCPDRRAGKKRLLELKNRVCDGDGIIDKVAEYREVSLATDRIFIEKEIEKHPRTEAILSRFPGADVELIDHYKDVYYNASGNANNKRKKHIILAKKKDDRILPGAPVCQDFDESYFYYTSCATGCLYDCEYCYLKGMHPSGDLLIHVNIEDTFREVEEMLTEHEVYLCLSYDTDLIVLEELTGYVSLWSEFVRSHPGLLAECRTKCARNDLWDKLEPCERMIFAFTLSPEEVINAYEHRTPTLLQRLRCAKEALDLGFTVRLCFDPMLRIPGWKEAYARMVDTVNEELPLAKVRDVSVGTFRISQDYLKRLRAAEPNSAAVQYPFVNEGGVYGYPANRQKEMTVFLSDKLRGYTPDIRIDTLA